ncbi:OapA N-terminal domain-containing protein, partial [Vibrio parahaemolyticus]
MQREQLPLLHQRLLMCLLSL